MKKLFSIYLHGVHYNTRDQGQKSSKVMSSSVRTYLVTETVTETEKETSLGQAIVQFS